MTDKPENGTKRAPPPRPAVKRRVVIPSSIFVGEDARLATFRLGLIARYLSIFRVEEVLVFGKENSFVVDVLRYAETPQYLRKKLIPLKGTLKYCGVIPPLQSPHHPPSIKGRGYTCEYREGVVLKALKDAVLVDVGIGRPVLAKGHAKPRERVTVMMHEEPRLVERSEVPYYWGYKLSAVSSLLEAIAACRDFVKIATSRLGSPVKDLTGKLIEEARRKGKVAIFFGERERGLMDIASDEGFDPIASFDYIVNLVPYQGTFTIRTEEAIPIALAILDFLLD